MTAMVPQYNFAQRMRDLYKGETPAQQEARYAANKERTETMLKQWHDFKTKYPDLAERMVC